MVDRPERPNALGLRSYSHEPPQFSSNASVANLASASMSNLSLADLPSPRAGDAPPALSPLDQLALQGRLLAKRFEQADKSGRRLSRLAPLTIQNEFGNRSGYFSSLSSTAGSPNEDPAPSQQVVVVLHRLPTCHLASTCQISTGRIIPRSATTILSMMSRRCPPAVPFALLERPARHRVISTFQGHAHPMLWISVSERLHLSALWAKHQLRNCF